MSQSQRSDITFQIDKLKNFPQWYEEIVALARLVDKRNGIKGCTVMPPYGCFIHSQIMHFVEDEFIKIGIPLAQFPTVIPENILCKEKEHLEGFAPEVFWVTQGGNAELNPRLALRPTSETIMYSMFANWVRSYRDLPVCVQQSCQVFRCETKDTAPLIRAREIYWNEAHCCHATAEESEAMCVEYWKVYKHLYKDILCTPGLYIRRPPWDTFPGAVYTDVIDVIMPSGRVLQAASAHFLGQSFSRMYDVRYYGSADSPDDVPQPQKPPKKEKKKDKKQKGEESSAEGAAAESEPVKAEETPEASSSSAPSATGEPADGSHYPYMSCAGISTRGMASAISVHGDNKGLVLPTEIAPYQIVIIPILRGKGDTDAPVLECTKQIAATLREAKFRVQVDDAPGKPGKKFFYWEMKGVPCRIEIGAKDMEQKVVTYAFRDVEVKPKPTIPVDHLVEQLHTLFAEYNHRLYAAAEVFHNNHVELFSGLDDGTLAQVTVEDIIARSDKDDISKPCVFRIPFVDLHDPLAKELDKQLREKTGMEVRGYSTTDPAPREGVNCAVSGKPAKCYVYIARAY